MPEFTNRLATEQSPYLLQHAHNPVDWFPWSDEAFETAKRVDKPIFLSIGYATCHWCHVMERESFEHEEIARLMNDAFVCIKVDREERPDIDNIYMTVCQMMAGQGGWPLTIIMTPEKMPFHAATYIPPDARFGRIGMRELIPRISDAWKNRRGEIDESAAQITQVLAAQSGQSDGTKLNAKVLEQGYRDLMGQYDAQKGGFGGAPKFPTPHRLLFLLRYGDTEGIKAAEHTLEAMRKGGIFDHIGFGFHRYSTDREWLLPHFEKMLYDQAMLTLAYTAAYELTRKPLYRRAAEETLAYVLRDMTAPEGGFYSAEDADSEGEEGLFYVWDAKEMESILGDDYAFAARIWNIRPDGNFHDEATRQPSGTNIPHLAEFPAPAEVERLETLRKKLFEMREKRIHPLKDTKILADWNGLVIAALAQAGRVFGEQRYVEAARRASDFVGSAMQQPSGELWHRFREGHTAVPGQLEDYAFMIYGLLELYDATLDIQCLRKALAYNEVLAASFADSAGGGYFMTSSSAEELIVRPKSVYDGAIPSGNSMQMFNLLRLARLTGRFELEQQAADVGMAFGGVIQRSPSAFAQALVGFHFGACKSREIVLLGRRSDAESQGMLDCIRSKYQPGMTLLFKDVDESDEVEALAPFTRDLTMIDGQPTVYVCTNFSCDQPIVSLPELQSYLSSQQAG